MGQEDRKNRPLAERARTENIAAGLFYNAIHHGEAETGALSDVLGGKKRFEDFVFYFRRDAMSEILDLDCDIIGWNQRCLIETGAFGRHDIAGPQDDLAALRHRVARIDDQIDEDMLELVDIGLDEPEVAAVAQLEIDFFADKPAHQHLQIGEHIA